MNNQQQPNAVSTDKVTVCIPTYWTSQSGFPAIDRLTNIYDHPTPIDQQGTLERCLASFPTFKGNVDVVIIGTVTEPELQESFQKKLKKMLAQFKNLNLYWFSHNELAAFHKLLDKCGNSHQKKYINLEGYSNLRNLCTILPHILKSDLAMLIDDDQLIADENFIDKAREFIGEKVEDELVLAKSGMYVKKDDELELRKHPWWEWGWPKNKHMQTIFTRAKSGPRISEAPFALGGAMVIHKEIFERVSFDPWALRGEDIDYLINCKLLGFQFFIDNELTFLHLPPKHASSTLVVRQDMYRFIYEKEKLEYAFNNSPLEKFLLEELDPYPGKFLRKDVGRRALSLALSMSLKHIGSGDFVEQLKLIKTIMIDASRYAKRNRSRWLGFQKLWPNFMQDIADIDATKVLTKIN